MPLDLRCGDVNGVTRRRCQQLAGHEADHGAVVPGESRRIFSFWATGYEPAESPDPLGGAGRPWAPGFPRVEAVPLVAVPVVATTSEPRTDEGAAA